ncbi:hypothetical protein AgCh_005952 [Apium graveolens]
MDKNVVEENDGLEDYESDDDDHIEDQSCSMNNTKPTNKVSGRLAYARCRVIGPNRPSTRPDPVRSGVERCGVMRCVAGWGGAAAHDDKSKAMVPIYGFETLMVMSRSCSSNASRINPIL